MSGARSTAQQHAARYPRQQFTSNDTGRERSTGGKGADRGTDEPEAKGRGRKQFSHRGTLARDIRALMYAFGDSPEADPASVDLLEDLTVDFLTDLCHRARPSPYAVPQGPGIRALVPASEIPASGNSADIHPAAISALASASSSSALAVANSSSNNQNSNNSGALGSSTYVPLPPYAAGHPFYTRAKIKVDDLKHALRKDGKKYARVEELIYLDKEIRAARAQMDLTKESAALVGASGPSTGT
ncbi:hypothetical protein OC846_001859 [Tilletia horrida]|uniref:Transcription initiation factor TFIID subunit 13 n=1 Tax=Tilletia horrida TaxID=155126 RepID=A0AAN6JSN4_9BASI|nr:hypothetical protein OC846_001859 [Tilletia horrida]KAK0568376.1 hypothetical protein OC861_002005 [Tilletia horrida]